MEWIVLINSSFTEETIIEVEPTSLQKQYYRAIFEKNRTFLAKGASSRVLPSLMNVVMQLRKVRTPF